MIKSINLEIIDICNLKCKICDIWTNKNANILDIRNIKNILGSKFINKDTDISITGGEPLIYDGIENIFFETEMLGFKINTLSTNGTLSDKLLKLLDILEKKSIRLPNIHISIDGNEKDHDLQRGINGSFFRSIETIIKLKKIFENINIKIKYTITENNITNIVYVYNLSKKLGVDISYKVVENDINYTNKKITPNTLSNSEKITVQNILVQIYGINNKYINNLSYYLLNNKLSFKCITPEENLFIMASGEVYPCTKYKSIGNIKEYEIDKLLYNNIHNSIINEVKENNCSKCFSLHGSYKTII